MKIPGTKVFPLLLSFQNENNTGSVRGKQPGVAWDSHESDAGFTSFLDTLPGGHAWSQQGSGSACGGRVQGPMPLFSVRVVLNAGCCSWWGFLADSWHGACSLVDRLV